MNTKLSPAEVRNLIVNVYGFIDDHGSIMYGHKSLIGEKTFWLNNLECEDQQFLIEGAEISENYTVCFFREDGGVESFTALIPLNQAKDIQSFLEE